MTTVSHRILRRTSRRLALGFVAGMRFVVTMVVAGMRFVAGMLSHHGLDGGVYGGAVIGSVVNGTGIGAGWFCGRIADVRRDGLAAAVVPTLTDPVAQIDDAGAGRVVGDSRSLGYRVCRDRYHARTTANDRVDDRSLARPVQAAHLDDRSRRLHRRSLFLDLAGHWFSFADRRVANNVERYRLIVAMGIRSGPRQYCGYPEVRRPLRQPRGYRR